MIDRHFCVHHKDCLNVRCLHKPDKKELEQLKDRKLVAIWFDDGTNPSGRVNCQKGWEPVR